MSHDPLQGISLDEKKKCSETIRDGSKKVGLNSTFFFFEFLFRSLSFRAREQVNRQKIFLENNRNRSDPLKKTGVAFTPEFLGRAKMRKI